MNFMAIIGVIVLSAAVGWLLFSGADSNLIVQLESESRILELQQLLDGEGIKTVAKNLRTQGLIVRRGGEFAHPSLHVINPADLQRALESARRFFDHQSAP